MFTIYCDPMGKQRPRFRTIKKKNGDTFVSTYTDKKTMTLEEEIRTAYQEQEQPFLEGEITAEINLYYSIPKSTSKKIKN